MWYALDHSFLFLYYLGGRHPSPLWSVASPLWIYLHFFLLHHSNSTNIDRFSLFPPFFFPSILFCCPLSQVQWGVGGSAWTCLFRGCKGLPDIAFPSPSLSPSEVWAGVVTLLINIMPPRLTLGSFDVVLSGRVFSIWCYRVDHCDPFPGLALDAGSLHRPLLLFGIRVVLAGFCPRPWGYLARTSRDLTYCRFWWQLSGPFLALATHGYYPAGWFFTLIIFVIFLSLLLVFFPLQCSGTWLQ